MSVKEHEIIWNGCSDVSNPELMPAASWHTRAVKGIRITSLPGKLSRVAPPPPHWNTKLSRAVVLTSYLLLEESCWRVPPQTRSCFHHPRRSGTGPRARPSRAPCRNRRAARRERGVSGGATRGSRVKGHSQKVARCQRRPEDPPVKPSRLLFQNTISDDKSRCVVIQSAHRAPSSLHHGCWRERVWWWVKQVVLLKLFNSWPNPNTSGAREPPPLSLSHFCMTAACRPG